MAEINIKFTDLGLSDNVLKSLTDLNYTEPTPIQQKSIIPLLEGRDIIGQAQTGTGKTAAFALPLISKTDFNDKAVKILVMTPTRELAIQVAEACKSFGKHIDNFNALTLYGGQSMSLQLQKLKKKPQVIVGTPGRLMDHLRRGSLCLKNLESLVLDEADEMLKMGFIDDIEWILERTPKTRQSAFFSATMPSVIRRVAENHLNNPVKVKIENKTSTVDVINQEYVCVNSFHKFDALSRLLEIEDVDGVIIFVRTRTATTDLCEKLDRLGYSTAPLHGDLNQSAREKTIDLLKKNRIDIVVATDVAARGLDVPRISHVFNYDIPYDSEAYVHRIGRTGRAGRSGKAFLIITHKENRMLRTIERDINLKIKKGKIPTADEVASKRLKLIASNIDKNIAEEKINTVKDYFNTVSKDLEYSIEEVALSLFYQLQAKNPIKVNNINFNDSFSGREGRGGDNGGRRREFGRNSGSSFSLGRASRLKSNPEINMTRYKIEVGRAHNVNVGNIVGAIANEANLASKYIGQIKLHNNISTVDLPEGMSKDVMNQLTKVRICGQKLNIQEVKSTDSGSGGSYNKSYRAAK